MMRMKIVPSNSTNRQRMPKGTVKWFSNKRGYGFIEDPKVGSDIFVHFSSIVAEGYRTLKQGESVEYDLLNDQKGFRAARVMRISGE